MYFNPRQISEITGADALIRAEGEICTSVGYDTRRLSSPKGMLFCCLSGPFRSGSQFIPAAYQAGVRSFLLKEKISFQDYPEANFYQVPDPLKALQQLAAAHRKAFTGPVVGITGSNGKTIVKEWLYQLLQPDFQIGRSPRSFNSQLGVAISLLGLTPEHNMGIFEAGISAPGEMQSLEKMIQPSLGIFTHLGSAHDENFKNPAEKVKEKLQLFANADVLIYPADSEEIRSQVNTLKAAKPLLKTISWGHTEGSSLRITGIETQANRSTIHFVHRGSSHQIRIPFSDGASVENAMSCLCALIAFERWDEAHIRRFENLHGLENRLSFFEGKNQNYVVNDSYSNDSDSLQVAIDFFKRQQPGKPQLVILSDLDQADTDKARLYAKVAAICRENELNHLILVGNAMMQNAAAFDGMQTRFFPDTDTLLASGALDALHGQSVLIKGSRRFHFENLVRRLQKQLHQTTLEIDLMAIRHNYTWFRNRCKPGTAVMAMVKAFGYGSGSFEVAKTLQFLGAEYLAVAFADEGVALRQAGISTSIMVMNATVADAEILSEYRLEPVIFDSAGIRDWAASGCDLNVHIEIDTGMHRLGFEPDKIDNHFVHFPDSLRVKSVFSHFSASEDPQHDTFTNQQLETFLFVCTNIENQLGYSFLKHMANTGAILRFPGAHLDMVRLGIGLYGVDPGGARNENLQVVASLKTRITQLHRVKSGESVGYARKAVSQTERVIATLPVGYADGLWRKLGNGNGAVWIAGKLAPFTGNICMDMCMVDVTGIPCRDGDEAEIFGTRIPVEQLAAQCDTIPYEILTSVSQRVRREYIGEN